MSRHAPKAATAISSDPTSNAAARDTGDPVPHTVDRDDSTLLGRMLRLLGFTTGGESTAGFELVPSADADAEASGKGDNAPGQGAQPQSAGRLCMKQRLWPATSRGASSRETVPMEQQYAHTAILILVSK
jgi:hypothetical protein